MLDPLLIVVAVALILLEATYAAVARKRFYSLRHTLASLVIFAGWAFSLALPGFLLGDVFAAAGAHNFVEISFSGWSVLVAVLLIDFGRYWHHRASHYIGWLWAEHAVHHSATELNVSSALRQGWLGILAGTWLVTLALVWIGFDATTLFVAVHIHLFWELLIHNEWVGRLGPFERILMTPANHRVHHGIEPEYLDRNFGGMTVLWDRLFGTWTPLGVAPTYGLVDGRTGNNPLRIVTYQWQKLLTGLVGQKSWRARWRALALAAAEDSKPRG